MDSIFVTLECKVSFIADTLECRVSFIAEITSHSMVLDLLCASIVHFKESLKLSCDCFMVMVLAAMLSLRLASMSVRCLDDPIIIRS